MLLRSVVPPCCSSLTVIASFVARWARDAGSFDHLFGFPALDLPVPLLSFLFLVALGRGLQHLPHHPDAGGGPDRATRRSVVTALAVTGGVITSAGILLAAVFTVLGVLPIITLTQIGIIVGFGILLDTLLVRTVLVPAMVTLVGPRFWWPSSPRVR